MGPLGSQFAQPGGLSNRQRQAGRDRVQRITFDRNRPAAFLVLSQGRIKDGIALKY
jgi:hypothetical protein